MVRFYDDAIFEIVEADNAISLIDIDHVAYDRYYGRNDELIYNDTVHYTNTLGADFVNAYIIESLYD